MKRPSDCRVLVVGGGVIRLTSALALLQNGFKSVRVVADNFDATTSHVAGGLWMPFSLPNDAKPQCVNYIIPVLLIQCTNAILFRFLHLMSLLRIASGVKRVINGWRN